MKSLRYIFVLIIVVLVLVASLVIYFSFFGKQDSKQVQVVIDKTVIVEKVKELSKLQSLEMLIQRDLQVTIDLGSLNLLGFNIPSSRTQKIYATGKVIAGTDFSKIDTNKVNFDKTSNKVSLELPAPEILAIIIDEDKTTVLRDDLTILFQIQNFISGKKDELNQELQRQVVKQTKTALLDGACTDNILDKSSEKTKQSVKHLFTFASVSEVDISVASGANCQMPV